MSLQTLPQTPPVVKSPLNIPARVYVCDVCNVATPTDKLRITTHMWSPLFGRWEKLARGYTFCPKCATQMGWPDDPNGLQRVVHENEAQRRARESRGHVSCRTECACFARGFEEAQETVGEWHEPVPPGR